MRKPPPEFVTNISLHDVYRVVDSHFEHELRKRCRKTPFLAFRSIFYSLAKDFVVEASLDDIANMVGMTHATVINGLARFPQFVRIPKYRALYNDCHDILTSITKVKPEIEAEEVDLERFTEPIVHRYESEVKKLRTEFHMKEKALLDEIDRLKTLNIVLKSERRDNPIMQLLDQYDHDSETLKIATEKVRTVLHRNEVRKRERARFETGKLKTA
jgi:hypothetical protein